MSRTAFHHSVVREPHRVRTKYLLARHPEVRDLLGRNRLSFEYVVGPVALQVTLAYSVRARPLWVMFLVAYSAGALANLPHVIPSSVSFQNHHTKHHSHQGVYELDTDLPHAWEVGVPHVLDQAAVRVHLQSREIAVQPHGTVRARAGPSERRVPPRPRDSGELGPE